MMYGKNDIMITLSAEEKETISRMVMVDQAARISVEPQKGDLVKASGVGVGVVIEEMCGTDLIKVSWFTQGVFGFAPYTVTEDHRDTVTVIAKST